MNREKAIRERFKVFEKLVNIGYNTDSKVINLKVEELLLQPNFNRGELMIAVGIKNANGCMYLRGPVLVFAVFFDHKLGAIRIPIFGEYSAMISPLEQLYGTPEFNNGLFTWEGENTDMVFTATNVQKNDGIIYLISNKLRK